MLFRVAVELLRLLVEIFREKLSTLALYLEIIKINSYYCSSLIQNFCSFNILRILMCWQSILFMRLQIVGLVLSNHFLQYKMKSFEAYL